MLTYIYISVIGIAFFSSLVSFARGFPYHLKFFSVLLGLTFVVECTAVGLWKTGHSNVYLYNAFMLVEFWSYGYYYYRIVESAWIKRIAGVFLWVFPIFWAVSVFWIFGGWNKWNSYVVIAGSLGAIGLSCVYYYQLFTKAELVRLGRLPEFWIATGLLLFYACNLPYMGMLNFLVHNYLTLAQQMLTALDILNIVMYSFFIYAYLCRIIIKR